LINQDLVLRYVDAGVDPKDFEFIDYMAELYWKRLIEAVKKNGSDVILLEDIEDYREINEAFVKTRSLSLEGDLAGAYNVSLELRRLQEFVKHDIMLSRTDGLDAVVVGVGHSDYWMSKPDIAQRFSGYSVETIDFETGEMRIGFLADTVPDPQNVFMEENLIRCLKIRDQGYLSEKEPDFTGTWDLDIPARGHFEMFVDFEKENAYKGRIIDCNGDAIFSGVKGKKFVKLYDEEFRIPEAASFPIPFNIEKGIYFDRGFILMEGRRSVDELTQRIASLKEK